MKISKLPKKPADYRNPTPAPGNGPNIEARKPAPYHPYAVPVAGEVKNVLNYERTRMDKEKGAQMEDEDREVLVVESGEE
jgi:hypothetical protein